MHRNDLEDPDHLATTLKWAKRKLTDMRVDERHKVQFLTK